MPVQVDWLDNQQDIVILRFTGTWTWDEFFPARQQARELIQTVDHTVHIILDWTASDGRLPGNLISNLRRAAQQRLPNTGRFYILSSRYILAKTLINMTARMSDRIPLMFVDSIDDVVKAVRSTV